MIRNCRNQDALFNSSARSRISCFPDGLANTISQQKILSERVINSAHTTGCHQ